MTVFLILVPLFLVVGFYLIWYSRRTRRLITAFAGARNLPYRSSDSGQLEAALDAALELDGPGQVRSFGQIRDLVDGRGVVLFRTVELLDLRRHGSSETTHHARVAVTFQVSQRHDLFVLVHPDLRFQSMLASKTGAQDGALGVIRRVLEEQPPRCPLSLTLKRGRGLIYLEPLVTGSIRSDDPDYLIATGQRLRAALA